TQRTLPILVSGLTDITEVAAGDFSSYALAADGSLWAWGDNSSGELGVGDMTDRLIPTQVLAPAGYRFTSIDSDSRGSHVVATVVPEPGALSLLVFGGLTLLRRQRA